MKFSVLMSLYAKEGSEHLQTSLESVFGQTLKADEVVLVEDGPLPDNLHHIVNEFQNEHTELKIVPISLNVGLGWALNIGLEQCTNDLIARMDTDDICKPDRFEKQVRYMEDHPEVDMLGAWIDEFEDSPENVVSTRTLPETHDELYEFGKKRCPVNHPVVMFRKQAVMAAGGYLHFPLFEDYYLWARMMMNGAKFHNLQESLLWFRRSPQMIRRRGGLRYAKDEMRLQWELHKIGYINLPTMLQNMAIRLTVRLIPNSLRCWVYARLLRR